MFIVMYNAIVSMFIHNKVDSFPACGAFIILQLASSKFKFSNW